MHGPSLTPFHQRTLTSGGRGGGRATRGEAHEARRGLWCHGSGLMRRGRRIGGGARKKRERAAVFDEEEEEGIDLRQALAVIYQGDLLPVPATSWE